MSVVGMPQSHKISFDLSSPNISSDKQDKRNNSIADRNASSEVKFAHDIEVIENRYHEQDESENGVLSKIDSVLLSRLSHKQVKAIMLLADGGFDDIDVARACNVTLQILFDWKRNKYFNDALSAIYAQVSKRLKTIAFARKEVRVQTLNSIVEGLNKIITQRGASGDVRLLTVEQINVLQTSGVFSSELAEYLIQDYGQYNTDNPQNNAILSRFVDLSKVNVPGYETGLMVSEQTNQGIKTSVDTQLIKTLQETLNNIAKELGQITTKEEIVVQQKMYGSIDFENDI